MKKTKLIKGKKICLKFIEEKDIEFLRSLRNKPENRRIFFIQDYISKEKQKTWFRKYLKDESNLMFVILDSKSRRQGCIGIYDIDQQKGMAEIGRLIIRKESRRKNYAREAIKLLQTFALQELNLESIYLCLFTNNKPAYFLYKGLGFKEKKKGKNKQQSRNQGKRITMKKNLKKN